MLTVNTEVVLGVARRAYELSGPTLRIGRAADCELVLVLPWLGDCVAVVEAADVAPPSPPASTTARPADPLSMSTEALPPGDVELAAVRVRVPAGGAVAISVSGVPVLAGTSAVCQLPAVIGLAGPEEGQRLDVQLLAARVARVAAAVEASHLPAGRTIDAGSRGKKSGVTRQVARAAAFTLVAVALAVGGYFVGRRSTVEVPQASVPGTTASEGVSTWAEAMRQSRTERARLEQMLAQANNDLTVTKLKLDERSSDLIRTEQMVADLRGQLARRTTPLLVPPVAEAPPETPEPRRGGGVVGGDVAAAARAVAAAEEARQARLTEEFSQAADIKRTEGGEKAWKAACEAIKARLTEGGVGGGGGLVRVPGAEDPLVWVVRVGGGGKAGGATRQSGGGVGGGVVLVRGYADEYSSTGLPLRYYFLARLKADTMETLSLELIN